MNKILVRFAMLAAVLCVIGGAGFSLVTMARADAQPEALLPQMGMMRSSQNVTMVNLEPVRVEIAAGSALPITLRYGEQCYMPKGTPFVAVGVDGDRVLVRSRQTGPIYLYDEGLPKCNDQALFWVHKQQFILAAAEYQRAEQARTAALTEADRDRRIIRRLLDEQLARK
jgi:hypothetical protein